MHGGAAGEPVHGAVQRLDAPRLHVVHVDVEGGLVELDDVDARAREIARLRVEHAREGHGKAGAVAVMLVGERVHDGHRPRERELHRTSSR
jgi:hypothetical protein